MAYWYTNSYVETETYAYYGYFEALCMNHLVSTLYIFNRILYTLI